MAHVAGGAYAGSARAGRAAGTARGEAGNVGGRARSLPMAEQQEDEGFDWERVAVFGAGIALGAVLGASVTMFTAPLSGPAARRAVRRGARRALWRGQDAWEDLRDELAAATLRRKKQLRRGRRRVRSDWQDV